jgi:hypothetical protein
MRAPIAILLAIAALTLAPIRATARELTTGAGSIWVGLNGNSTPLIGPTTGFGMEFQGSELGVHLGYSRALSAKWTAVLSGGFGVGSSQFKPAAGPTVRLSSSSWNLRIGVDRYAYINDEVAVYAGPGLLYWRGNAEVDGTGNDEFDGDWPTVRQIGFNGRFGMKAHFAPHYALFGHIGQVIASNNSKNGLGRNTWWTNHHEGSVGIAVDL